MEDTQFFVASFLWLAALLMTFTEMVISSIPPQARRAAECACGYDLTGNVSGICPECGRVVPGIEQDREAVVGEGLYWTPLLVAAGTFIAVLAIELSTYTAISYSDETTPDDSLIASGNHVAFCVGVVRSIRR